MRAATTHMPYQGDSLDVGSMLLNWVTSQWREGSWKRAEGCILLSGRKPPSIRVFRRQNRLGNAYTGCPRPQTPARRRRR